MTSSVTQFDLGQLHRELDRELLGDDVGGGRNLLGAFIPISVETLADVEHGREAPEPALPRPSQIVVSLHPFSRLFCSMAFSAAVAAAGRIFTRARRSHRVHVRIVSSHRRIATPKRRPRTSSVDGIPHPSCMARGSTGGLRRHLAELDYAPVPEELLRTDAARLKLAASCGANHRACRPACEQQSSSERAGLLLSATRHSRVERQQPRARCSYRPVRAAEPAASSCRAGRREGRAACGWSSLAWLGWT